MKEPTSVSVALSPATRKELKACVDILMDSILGEEYFTRDVAEPLLSEAIGKKEVTVATTDSGEVVGFYRLVMDGVFLVFAYIHLIAVKTDYRGLGIGTKILRDAERRILEERGYPDVKKSFLLVGKINRRAKRYYERNGYERVSTLRNLFADGDTEFLMAKDLGRVGAR
jgi:ribosomal protein S18 acetylase RimI-like enzyme